MTSSRPAKSTRKYFVTSSGIHSDQEKYSAWEALHHAMAESPRHYPVNDWRYRHPLADAMDAEMDLWPVIKTLYMVGACHRVHAGTNNKPPAPALPAPAVPRALVTGTPPITRMRWPNLDCEILMLGSSVGNHDVDGYRAQHHLDPLREALSRYGMRSTTLLIDVKSEVVQPAPALLGATIGAAGIFRAIQSHLRPSGSLALDDLPGFEAWHAEISALYPLDDVLTRRGLEEIIEKIYSAAYCLRRYFAQQAIKGVIGYCYYGVVGFATALACRALGIPFFDMQHGSAGPHHHCYHWPGMPDGGYNTLPTHFLCWSAVESEAIVGCAPGSGPRALTVGHSWRLMEQLLQESGIGGGKARYLPPTIKAHYASQGQLAAQRLAARDALGLTTVLLTLRANEDIAWLAPLLTATDANLHFLIRLHPAESRDEKCLEARTTALETPRVEVMRASRTPMSVLLRECSLHLTGYSSSILDALAFAVPSLCYAWSSKWFYNPAHYPFVRMVTPEVDAVMEAIRTHGPAITVSPAAPLCLTLNELGRQLTTEILTPHTRKKV